MIGRFAGFEWDEGNSRKCQGHGLMLTEIEGVLRGSMAVRPDCEHSDRETRFLGVGRTLEGRHVFVAFTVRDHVDGSYVRPISARYLHRKEIERYEQANS